MKKCRFTEESIQKFLDKSLLPAEEKEFLEHLHQCKKCKTELESYLNILNQIKKIKQQPLPPGFEQRLHQKLMQYVYKTEKYRFYPSLLPTFATVAVVVFLVITSLMIWKNRKQIVYHTPVLFYSADESYTLTSLEGSNHLPIYNKANLRVKLKTDKELKNVEVLINLPAELCVDGKQRIVRWRGDLKPGENYLILSVMGQSSGVYPVDITIKQNSKKKTIKTSLKII